MPTVATIIRCRGNTACGVRLAFVVALACLSNVAVAGFVPAGSGVSLEMHSELRPSHWLSTFLGWDLLDAGGSTEDGPMGASPNPIRPLPDVPHQGLFIPDQVAALGNYGGSGATGSSAAGPQTMGDWSILPSNEIQFNPPLFSRVDADEKLRLPRKLPYKLFRPPKVS